MGKMVSAPSIEILIGSTSLQVYPPKFKSEKMNCDWLTVQFKVKSNSINCVKREE